MSKSSKRRGPLAEYDRFMIGGQNSRTPRGILLTAGGIIGNTIAWLLGLITIANLGALLAFFVVAAVSFGVLQRIAPTLDLPATLLVSAIVALILVTIGVILIKLVLHRDSQRLGQQPTFGVFDEDARTRDKQNYRRKSGR